VTDLAEVVSRLERGGGKLALDGERIRYSIPSGDTEALALLAELRSRPDGVKALLVQRMAGQSSWAPAPADAERRFGQPHARLFPFLGRKVRTPGGAGTLLQVFADRVTVLLDSELSKCVFFRPAEIEPVSKDM
jgi:hypothetical protein